MYYQPQSKMLTSRLSELLEEKKPEEDVDGDAIAKDIISRFNFKIGGENE